MKIFFWDVAKRNELPSPRFPIVHTPWLEGVVVSLNYQSLVSCKSRSSLEGQRTYKEDIDVAREGQRPVPFMSPFCSVSGV